MPMSINRKAQEPVFYAPGEGKPFSLMGINNLYKTTGKQSAGQFLVVEGSDPAGSGPPPRWHKVTTVIVYILSGSFSVQLDDKTYQAGPGSYIYIPPHTVYSFVNQSEAESKYLLIASPAWMEEYADDAAELMKNEDGWPPKDMSPYLKLMAKYDLFEPPVE